MRPSEAFNGGDVTNQHGGVHPESIPGTSLRCLWKGCSD